MVSRVTRGMACIAVGLLLSACGSPAATAKAPRNQRQLEASACRLISATPIVPPGSGSFVTVSVRTSTLLALQRTDDSSLQAALRLYDKAAKERDDVAMIRALNIAVNVCHALGLKTAT